MDTQPLPQFNQGDHHTPSVKKIILSIFILAIVVVALVYGYRQFGAYKMRKIKMRMLEQAGELKPIPLEEKLPKIIEFSQEVNGGGSTTPPEKQEEYRLRKEEMIKNL